jgi:phospholipase/carboxylesterase
MYQPMDARANDVFSGPRLAPASGGPARRLVILLHGYGADGNDLIDLGRYWASELPDAAFFSPHAPEPFPGPFGRQWFQLDREDAESRWRGAVSAAPALHRLLDAELASHNLDDSVPALVGFSQGAMMALHVGPRRAGRIAGILGYSGLLVGPEHLAEARHKPPVMLVQGDSDAVVPFAAMAFSEKALKAAGFAVETHGRGGLQHGIDGVGLGLGGQFLKRVLAG